MRLFFLYSIIMDIGSLVKILAITAGVSMPNGCISGDVEQLPNHYKGTPSEIIVDQSILQKPEVNSYLSTILENVNYDASKLTTDHSFNIQEVENSYVIRDGIGKIVGLKNTEKLYDWIVSTPANKLENEHFEENAWKGFLLGFMGKDKEAEIYLSEAYSDGVNILGQVTKENLSSEEIDYYQFLMSYTTSTISSHLNNIGKKDSAAAFLDAAIVYKSGIVNPNTFMLPNGLPRTDLTE